MRAVLVVNPRATSMSPQVADVIVRALSRGIDLDVVPTQERGHGAVIARHAAERGAEAVIALGGDGIANEVLNGLLANGPLGDGSGPVLAVVPGGSANVLARTLGFPADAVEATSLVRDALLAGSARVIGVGEVRAQEDGVGELRRWFAVNAGLGLDAEIIAAMDDQRRTGKKATPARYLATTLRQYAVDTDRRHPALEVSRPGGEPPVPVFLALVQNTAPWTYFGPWPIDACPGASFDAGLDLFAMRSLRVHATAAAAQRLITRGRLGTTPRSALTWHDQTAFALRAHRPVPLQLDGEHLGAVTEAAFRSVPRAVKVAVLSVDP